MTSEQAADILGPELTAWADARAAQAPPLTDAQIAYLAPLYELSGDPDRTADAA